LTPTFEVDEPSMALPLCETPDTPNPLELLPDTPGPEAEFFPLTHAADVAHETALCAAAIAAAAEAG